MDPEDDIPKKKLKTHIAGLIFIRFGNYTKGLEKGVMGDLFCIVKIDFKHP